MKRKLIWVASLIVVLFIAANWMYLRAQINYYVNPPAQVFTNPQVSDDRKVEPNRLWIESLGVEAPIVYIEGESEELFQEGLQSGVVHYSGTSDVGQYGNAYIMGHSSDFPTAPGNYKTVFATLPKINVGDEIKVSGKDGMLYNYVVDQKFVVKPSDTHVLDQDLTKKQLTLQTSYPIGTALRRYIVVAYLQE